MQNTIGLHTTIYKPFKNTLLEKLYIAIIPSLPNTTTAQLTNNSTFHITVHVLSRLQRQYLSVIESQLINNIFNLTKMMSARGKKAGPDGILYQNSQTYGP